MISYSQILGMIKYNYFLTHTTNAVFPLVDGTSTYNNAYYQNYIKCFNDFINSTRSMPKNPNAPDGSYPCNGADCYTPDLLFFIPLVMLTIGTMITCLSRCLRGSENSIRSGFVLLMLLTSAVNIFYFINFAQMTSEIGLNTGCYNGAVDSHNNLTMSNPVKNHDEFTTPYIRNLAAFITTGMIILEGILMKHFEGKVEEDAQHADELEPLQNTR